MKCKTACIRKLIMMFVLLIGTIHSAMAKQKPVIEIGRLPASFHLDGLLTKEAWSNADSVSTLTMIEPSEGAPPSNKTIVKILATSNTLILGFRCLDDNPEKIVAYAKVRDANLRREDHIRFILDTFMDGRSGYIFAVNPYGGRYDALVSDQREGENKNWDTVWEAKTVIGPHGWSAEIRIPIKSLSFKKGLRTWGFNVERRIQRLQETDRWAGVNRDYKITQISQAGLMSGLPVFDIGLGLSIFPSFVSGAGVPAPGSGTEYTRKASLDLSQKIGPNLQASVTVNTDFTETEVDSRRTNLTRFPLFFPEKRAFFLEGSDIFEFGLGIGEDIIPYFSRRIGLVDGQPVPIRVGGKLHGGIGNTNLGALMVKTGRLSRVAPETGMGVIRLKQNIFAESSVGIIATIGDPRGLSNSWLTGIDFTYKTTTFRRDKNFLLGVWGLLNHREDLTGDQTSYGFKIDYPNDIWSFSLTYKRIAENFQPSLGFVPRPGIHSWRAGIEFSPRPKWPFVRQMFHEFYPRLITNLNNEWESYRVFMAPINWRLESGDRFEFNIVPEGEKLIEPFEIADNVIIPPGSYHWVKYRLEGGLEAKRKISGQLTWWFGGFYSGRLDQIELTMSINPSSMITSQLSGELNYGRLKEGNFTQRLLAYRVSVNFSPDLQLSAFLQYDNESQTVGLNSKLRWTFNPLGDRFFVCNHNLAKSITDRWYRDSNQLLLKLRYGVRI